MRASYIRGGVTRLESLARQADARRRGVEISEPVIITGTVGWFRAPGSMISLGRGVILNSRPSRNTLEARGATLIRTIVPGARISIGPDSGLTCPTISAAQEVTIGARVLMGSGVVVTDSDHHLVDIAPFESRRHAGVPKPSPSDAVTIEDDVFVGARSIILKGVTIGRGSVIGAGSVVARSVPPGVLAAGNPCRVVRELRSSAAEGYAPRGE
jgi:acetyltransferase-like isoleucine patch superfamily enzyme